MLWFGKLTNRFRVTVGCILMHGRDWSPAGGVPNEERNGAKAEGRKAQKNGLLAIL